MGQFRIKILNQKRKNTKKSIAHRLLRVHPWILVILFIEDTFFEYNLLKNLCICFTTVTMPTVKI